MSETLTHTTNSVEFNVLSSNVDVAKERVEKLNKRAEKLGCSKLILTVGDVSVETVTLGVDDEGREIVRKVEFTKLTLVGDELKLAGWTFVASIEHTPEGNILRKVPGVEIDVPVEFREGGQRCDHCGHNRRRIDTFLAVSDAGEWKQIGRNCLRDFLGIDPASFLKTLGWWTKAVSMGDELSDFEGGGGRTEITFETVDFLLAVILSIRLTGWLSRTVARDFGRSATADAAIEMAGPAWDNHTRKIQKEFWALEEDADLEKAKAALAWAEETIVSKDVSVRSDYEHNLAVAVARGYVTRRTAGLVASLVVCYDRAMEREIKMKNLNKTTLNEWFGSSEPVEVAITRGKNKGTTKSVVPTYELTLTVERIISTESAWGTTQIHKMRDVDGRIFTWFGSCSLRTNDNVRIVEGNTFTAVWKVKKHSEYNGTKETVLTRPSKVALPA